MIELLSIAAVRKLRRKEAGQGKALLEFSLFLGMWQAGVSPSEEGGDAK